MSLWPKFTKEQPCPACGHWDWLCRLGNKKYICMRIESPQPAKDGGWYHEFNGAKLNYSTSLIKESVRTLKNFDSIIGLWEAATDFLKIETLAELLGVSTESLQTLKFCQCREFNSMAIPMRDGDNKIIGIQLRGESKKCITGSQLGLFIPQTDAEDVVFLPEGASDTAAFLTCGLYAIGRPSCNAGGEMLKIAIKRLGIKRAVIVVDNDSLKSAPNGREWRPGRDGAEKLQGQIGVPSCMWIPPSPLKDFRALLNKVSIQSARAIVTSSIAQKVWVRVRQ